MQASSSNAQTRAFISNTLKTFPRPDQAAAEAVRVWARGKGLDLDPDKVDAVTLHYQLREQRWGAVVARKMSLTQALLSNWQGESSNNLFGAVLHEPWAGDPPPVDITPTNRLKLQGVFKYGADYQIYNGLYRQSTPEHYGASNHVRIPAEDFQQFIWQLDFLTPYKATLKAFWETGLEHYRVALKAAFLKACNQQLLDGSLSEAGKQLAWQVAGVKPQPSWRSLGQRTRRYDVVQVSALDVYGYVSTDILYLRNNASQLTLLYIPGNSSPVHEFASPEAMKRWLAEQCKDSGKRQALLEHFRQADVPVGTDFSGVEVALEGLGVYPQAHRLDAYHYLGFATSGVWDPQHIIHYKDGKYSQPITGELFLALANRYRKRSGEDAEFVVSTDASVTKAKWRGYVSTTINLLTPLAMLVPALAPLVALGGVAQFGLALDELVNAKNQQEQLDGIEGQVFGVLNALPLLHALIPAEPELFTLKRPGFSPPQRLNGRIGYPLSPRGAPHLPPEEEALEPFFRDPTVIPPAFGADPEVAAAIVRIPSFVGGPDQLQCSIGGYLGYVEYDYERNAFRMLSNTGQAGDYYVAPALGTTELALLEDLDRVATPQQRRSTLQALGVHMRIPVDYPAMHPAGATAIPKKISCVWIGRRLMGEQYLRALASNSAILEHSQYARRIFLSSASPEAFAANSAKLRELAPAYEIIELESHEAYHAFAASDYFPQYQAALEGNGGVAINESSASDVLRYRLLHHEGGLYMDCDDLLIKPGQETLNDGPALAIDEVPFDTTSDGLLLNNPVTHRRMDLRAKFNTSQLASHPQNPTLDAVSDEMLKRYRASPDFYDYRPDKHLDLQGHQAYTRKLSYMTGPQVLNDVIDARLDPLAQLRENVAYLTLPRVDAEPGPLEPAAFTAARQSNLPFVRFAEIGSAASWD